MSNQIKHAEVSTAYDIMVANIKNQGKYTYVPGSCWAIMTKLAQFRMIHDTIAFLGIVCFVTSPHE